MTKSIDVRTPGIQTIAKKWKLSVPEVMRLVNDGAKVEKEHTKSLAKARQVARDHIAERPDYYKKLRKMEKTPIAMKEETGVSGVRGLGFVSGDPALDPVNQYINTNSMSYEDMNGAILKMIRDRHNNHSALGFTSYDPTDKQPTNKALKEGTLNELGQGMPGYEGLSDSARSQYRKDQLDELAPETLGSYIKKASASRKDALNKGGAKADVKTWAKRQYGITTAIKKLTNEETKMENNLINEALESILDNNLSEMKENLKLALQEKAIEKLEERKKEIAANYFAQ